MGERKPDVLETTVRFRQGLLERHMWGDYLMCKMIEGVAVGLGLHLAMTLCEGSIPACLGSILMSFIASLAIDYLGNDLPK
jgi:hypothetical protein